MLLLHIMMQTNRRGQREVEKDPMDLSRGCILLPSLKLVAIIPNCTCNQFCCEVIDSGSKSSELAQLHNGFLGKIPFHDITLPHKRA